MLNCKIFCSYYIQVFNQQKNKLAKTIIKYSNTKTIIYLITSYRFYTDSNLFILIYSRLPVNDDC